MNTAPPICAICSHGRRARRPAVGADVGPIGKSTLYPKLAVQASGGVASLDDLRALKAAGAAGAVVGKALYEDRLTLAEALAC
jgi:phosphoribosylformimino-5-aminoimidazole carboxamide ribonucleotide (ProFAR) isomerase